MLLLKVMLTALTSVILVLGVCESKDKVNETDQQRALGQAAIFAGDSLSNIPYTGKTYDCRLTVGLQPTAPAPTLHDVLGSCQWDVEPQNDSWIATFRETWFCSDWNATLTGYPPCDGLTGFHEWKYFVDLSQNATNLLDDTGQFAPDMKAN